MRRPMRSVRDAVDASSWGCTRIERNCGRLLLVNPAPQETPPPEHTTPRLSWAELVRLPIAPQGLPADITELCEGKLDGESAWIDRMHAGLYRTICLSAAGFDGFFGNARFDDEYQATHGSVAVGTLWDQRDHQGSEHSVPGAGAYATDQRALQRICRPGQPRRIRDRLAR